MAIKDKPVHMDCDQAIKKRKIAKKEDVARIYAEIKEEYAEVLAELAK